LRAALRGEEERTMTASSLRWTLLSMAGLAGGIALGVTLQEPIEAIVGMILVTPAVTLLVGAALGAAQWVELRRHLARAHRWLLATAVGLGAGLAGGVVAVEVVGQALLGHPLRLLTMGAWAQSASMFVVGALAGALLGLVQRASLRALPRAWPLVSGLGLAVGLAAGSLVAHALAGAITSVAGFALLVLCAGLVLGACTRGAVRQAA
jgi:hypothetical protein